MNESEFREWQVKRASRLLQKATGVKYTVCRRYIEEVFNYEKVISAKHYHVFSLYQRGQSYVVDDEIIFRLRCVTCGGTDFAFAVKTSNIVED